VNHEGHEGSKNTKFLVFLRDLRFFVSFVASPVFGGAPLAGHRNLLLLFAALVVYLLRNLTAQARRVGHHFIEAGKEFG
jgi:hypothetical protein